MSIRSVLILQVDKWETPHQLVRAAFTTGQDAKASNPAVLGPSLSFGPRLSSWQGSGFKGWAKAAMPGGCNIGARKIDMHILVLRLPGV